MGRNLTTAGYRPILITGATGFIGGSLASALGTQAVSWQRDTNGDLRSIDAVKSVLRDSRPSTVIHLAWSHTNYDNYESRTENLEWPQITRNLAQECVSLGIHFIGVGSATESLNSGSTPTNYSLAKAQARRQVLAIRGKITWIAPQYVFSLEHQRPRLIRELVNCPQPSNFEARRPHALHDFIHVQDVVSGLITAVNEAIYGPLYLGTGILRSCEELISATKKKLYGVGARFDTPVGPRKAPQEPTQLWDFGWSAMATDKFFGTSRD